MVYAGSGLALVHAAECCACAAEYNACATERGAGAAQRAPVQQNRLTVRRNVVPVQEHMCGFDVAIMTCCNRVGGSSREGCSGHYSGYLYNTCLLCLRSSIIRNVRPHTFTNCRHQLHLTCICCHIHPTLHALTCNGHSSFVDRAVLPHQRTYCMYAFPIQASLHTQECHRHREYLSYNCQRIIKWKGSAAAQ